MSIPALGLAAHDSARYFRSLEAMTARALEESSPCAEASPSLAAIARARLRAVEIEAATPPELRAEAIAKARAESVAKLLQSDPASPTIDRIRALPEPLDLPSRIKSRQSLRRIAARLALPQDLSIPPPPKTASP